jgi:hypothetical protein
MSSESSEFKRLSLDIATISNTSVTSHGFDATSKDREMVVRRRSDSVLQYAMSAESSAIEMQEYLEIQAVSTESP